MYHLLHVSIEILLHKSENSSLHVHVLNESSLHLSLMTSDLAVYPIHCISKILSSRYKGWFMETLLTMTSLASDSKSQWHSLFTQLRH